MFPPPTASEVRQAGFELVRGGYAVPEVDEYLDALEERVLVAQGRLAGRRGRPDPASEAEFLKAELTGPYMKRFAARLASCVAATTSTTSTSSSTGSSAALDGTDAVSVEDVRQVPFRPAAAATARTPSTTRWTGSSSTSCSYAGRAPPTRSRKRDPRTE